MSTYLRLFGRPQVEVDGVAAALPAERRCQLLVILALRRGWVSRTELAALLWPDRPAPLAATNVRKALHLARGLPWTNALELQGAVVRWMVATDVHEFEIALREGRSADAVNLGTAQLLDGMDEVSSPAWTEWLEAERAQHQRRWHELTRARLAELDGSPSESAAFARRLLAADALDEDAVVALLAAQRASGEHARQRDTYRSFATCLARELGVEPSLRVRELMRDPPTASAVSEAQPMQDGFFGRVEELGELTALLGRPECRLLTVTGPGGIGKSSLLKKALRLLERRFGAGSLWVPLDDLTEARQVAARIAGELKLVPASTQEPLHVVAEHLRSRELLLALDNAEHLHGLAPLIERLLAHTTGLKICTTSRVRLGAAGEWLLPLQGLALPDATRLFIAAAREAKPDFGAAVEKQAIDNLVRRVGTLPLAIRLAANWVRLLPVADILEEIERSLDVLEATDDGEERAEHRSVRATFDSSWEMLAPREQRALADLSVFVGTFSRAAALAVAQAALPLLAALVDKSLVQMMEGGRFSLHPLIRQFARERLLVSSDHDAPARRHAQWFLGLLSHRHDELRHGVATAHAEVELELENCRAAWDWAVDARADDLSGNAALALMRFAKYRGRSAEVLPLLERAARALEPSAPNGQRAACMIARAMAELQWQLGRLEPAIVSARHALQLATANGDRTAVVGSLTVLGLAHWQSGRYVEARRFFEQGLRLARAHGDAGSVGANLMNLALIEKVVGNYDRAIALGNEALELERKIGNLVAVSSQYNNLGNVYRARRDWAQARTHFETGLAFSEAHGHASVLPHFMINLASVSFETGEWDAARAYGLRALRSAREMGNRNIESQTLLHLARLAVRAAGYADARAQIRRAFELACAMGNEPIQLECAARLAEVHAAQGDALSAATLWSLVAGHPKAEATLRNDVRALLSRLPQQQHGAHLQPTGSVREFIETIMSAGAPDDADSTNAQSAERHGAPVP